jgi:pimeloyl-ACP methyl ester carboxylesterase
LQVVSVSGEVAVERFEIRVADAVLDDLRARLRRTRWATGVAARRSRRHSRDAWKAGTDPAYLRDLAGYWMDGYDWRRHEAALNTLPQYIARVADAHLHFVHVKGSGARSTPLLLLHGWPDSFYRYHRVIPMFANAAGAGADREDGFDGGFDVVVPSLPGFPFTGPLALAPHQPTRRSAELIWRLMTEVLGYQRFAIAGGDGGSVMAQILAIDHPGSVIALHLTDLGWHVAATTDPESVSRPERKYLQAARKQFMADGAYAMVQTTEPRTLAPALTDSPVGLASWIVDRFHSWSEPFADAGGDRGGGLSKDDLLTNIMLYWVTGAIGPSMFNYYAEARSPSLTAADRVPGEVAVALALFPRDIGGVPPRALAERTLHVRRWTEMPRGGHFAALEEPRLFARDVIAFLRPLVAADRRLTGELGDAHPAV